MSLIVSLLVLAGVIAYFLAGATLKPKWESEYKQRMEDFDCGLSTFLNDEEQRINEAGCSISKTVDFTRYLLYVGHELYQAVGYRLWVDDIRKKWGLSVYAERTPKRVPIGGIESIATKIYDYKDLIKYEVIEDGETVISGNAGKAVVGGILFGGIGAVAGAAASRTIKERQNIVSVQMRIRVKDIEQLSYLIDFRVPTTDANASKRINPHTGDIEYVRYSDKACEQNVETFVSILNYILKDSE